jgi:hypothetical protein
MARKYSKKKDSGEGEKAVREQMKGVNVPNASSKPKSLRKWGQNKEDPKWGLLVKWAV